MGIATQNPELRKRFEGKAAHVVNFFEFIAEEVREELARLGARSLDEIVGRVDLLEAIAAPDHGKLRGVALGAILDKRHLQAQGTKAPVAHKSGKPQRHELDKTLDVRLIEAARPALERSEHVAIDLPIANRDRAVGTMLGSEVTRRHGPAGLPDDTISLTFRGSAGQSFGAFVPRGITLVWEGEANDYLAKGLSGGHVVVVPPRGSHRRAEENVIAGNVVLYGATSGRVFVRGTVGERFAVRNSGAVVVVEGTGDHGCEYMTGGVAVVLGPTGRNFAAGMSGGVAYVRAGRQQFELLVNPELVDLEPLAEDDVTLVRTLIEEHARRTESELARRILDGDGGGLGGFLKIIPREYRRIVASGMPKAVDLEQAPAAAE